MDIVDKLKSLIMSGRILSDAIGTPREITLVYDKEAYHKVVNELEMYNFDFVKCHDVKIVNIDEKTIELEGTLIRIKRYR